MNYPDDLFYTNDHEWCRIEGNVATVGITDYAQDALGDVVFLELPEVERELNVGDVFGVVESIKAVSDLYSPFEGKVLEVNEALVDTPEAINKDPYGEAWLIKIEFTQKNEEMIDSSEYSDYLETIK